MGLEEPNGQRTIKRADVLGRDFSSAKQGTDEQVVGKEVCLAGHKEPKVWLAGKRPNLLQGDGSTVQPGSMARGAWLAIKIPTCRVETIQRVKRVARGSPNG